MRSLNINIVINTDSSRVEVLRTDDNSSPGLDYNYSYDSAQFLSYLKTLAIPPAHVLPNSTVRS